MIYNFFLHLVPNVGEFLGDDDSAQDAQSGTVEDSLIVI